MADPHFEDYSEEITPEDEYEGFVASMGGSLSEVKEVIRAVVSSLPSVVLSGRDELEVEIFKEEED